MTLPEHVRNAKELLSALRDVLDYARRVATEGDGPDLYELATELLELGPIDGSDVYADLELRITAAEGMMDALCGKGYHDDYGNTDMGTRQALAYCGGFCLVAPGGEYHRDRVREIMAADAAAQPPPPEVIEAWARECRCCPCCRDCPCPGVAAGGVCDDFACVHEERDMDDDNEEDDDGTLANW